MLKINKIVSETALPLTKQNNLINFIVPQEGSHLDLKDSYVQFTMDVTSALSERLSLGQDGFPYHPVALIRRARLVSSTKGVIQETNNLNILMENLLWNGRSSSEDQSEALQGWGAVPGADYMHSTFSDYPHDDRNCVVRIPMSHLFPGSVGKSEAMPTNEIGQLTVMLELEPTKSQFQQAVLPRWAGEDKYERGNFVQDFDMDGITGPTNVLVSTGVDFELFVSVGSIISVTYTAGPTPTTVDVVVLNVDGDEITVSQTIPASTNVKITVDNLLVHCATISGGTGATGPAVSSLIVPVDTTDGQQFNGEIPDLTFGPLPIQAQISYAYYPAAGGALIGATSQRVTITGVTGSGPWTAAFTPSLPAVPPNFVMGGINIQPLAVNINDAVWQVNQAYAFMYHLMGKQEKSDDKMFISTYTYEPVQQVCDGFSYSREVQVSGNAYGCFLLTPPASNTSQLISTASGVQNYRFFLDDVALSTIPLEIEGVTHLDMLMRVFNNSDMPLRNLAFIKDSPWFVARTGTPPASLVAKMKPRTDYEGSPNVMVGAPRRNLRVEMDGSGMDTAKTIYFFKNEWKMI